MAGFDFWRWSDPDSLNQQKARDFVEESRRQQEDHDRGLLQQHIGGILENFQADVARRMEPITSAVGWPTQTQAPLSQPSTNVGQPTMSPVDEVLSQFKSAGNRVADTAQRMGTDIGNAASYYGANPSKLVADPEGPSRAWQAVPEGVREAATSKYTMDPVGQGTTDVLEGLGVPGHESSLGFSAGPVEVGPREVAGLVAGMAFNPLGKVSRQAWPHYH